MSRTRCDCEDSLGDLLCDLMHWADKCDFDFVAALQQACCRYEAEGVHASYIVDRRPCCAGVW
jgi:hypothetical protein